MGDTITLGQYQDLMPERNDDGVIENSFLIVDEADAELLDTQPQELLGKEYGEVEAENRWEQRKRAKEAINEFIGSPAELEEYAQKNNLPLDFIVDAYEATKFQKRDENGNPINYQVKDGKIYVLNPNTNVMIPASQGLSQAIIANDEKLSEMHKEFAEYEVLGETDIPRLFSNFEIASLMSGTMQDKGMSEFSTPEQIETYKAARSVFLSRCGNGVHRSAAFGVMDWKLVTPKTRVEKGDAIVGLNGIKREEDGNIFTIPTPSEDIEDWRIYLEKYGEELETKWREAIKTEAETRSKEGQPVMISVYGDRNPSYEGVTTYTDKNQIGSKENGTSDHKIKDDTCMFVNDGIGEVACFDDFYGRGYTFKFIKREHGEVVKDTDDKPEKSKKGGHVLITALPQNSRNLEQFLFRVARGGDNGSSSVIISPNDPILVEYLERLEAEKGKDVANEYFANIMSGQKEIMEMVADIYPEQTIELFGKKAEGIDATRLYEKQLESYKAKIDRINQLRKNPEDRNVINAYEEEFRKQMVKRTKLNRQAGVQMENINMERETLLKETFKGLIANNKLKNAVEIVTILPLNMTAEELCEIITDEKLRDQIIALSAKIDDYIARKEKAKDSNEQVQGETDKQGRNIDFEIPEAALGDSEYNLEELKNALIAIREQKTAIRNPDITQSQETNGER